MTGVGIAGRPAGCSPDRDALEVRQIRVVESDPTVNEMIFSRIKKIAQLLGYARTIGDSLSSGSGIERACALAKDGRQDAESHQRRFRPISLEDANVLVSQYHRHNGPVQGAKFAIAVADHADRVLGVGIAGRPVGRLLDDRYTLEVTRVCVIACAANLNSAIYARIRRIGVMMGYRRIITYTLASEGGASLRAINATVSAVSKGGGWLRRSRARREQEVYYEPKIRWLLWPPPSPAPR